MSDVNPEILATYDKAFCISADYTYIGEIFAESGAVIGGQDLASLSEEVDVTSAERDLVAAENAILKDKVTALQAELDLVKMQLKHKEELLALHNYYNKIIPVSD